MDDAPTTRPPWHDARMPETLYTRTLRALQDTSACPACTTALAGARCPACGLDVSGPDGSLVWRDSQAVVRAMVARQTRIEALRAAQAAARAAARTEAGTADGRAAPGQVGAGSPASAPAAQPAVTPAVTRAAAPHHVGAPTPAPARPPASVPAVGRPAAPPAPVRTPRAPWRVQTVLQVVGASLLVAASITFLVFAWDVMGIRGRAAVIGVGTLVVFALASWLRARRLPQGAEAVAAVAVGLLLLDAWALRATGVLVVGDGPTQTAFSAAACGGLLTVWGAQSRLRTGAVAAAVLLALAPLAWLPTAGSTTAAAGLLLASGALTALRAVRPWSAHPAALHVMAATVLPAAVVVGLTAVATHLTAAPWPAVLVLAGACVVVTAQALLETRRVPDDAGHGVPPRPAGVLWARGAGVVGALTVACAAAAVAAGLTAPDVVPQAAVVGACLAAGALVVVARQDGAAGTLGAATRSAAGVAALGATWTVLTLVMTVLQHLVEPPSHAAVDLLTAQVAALVAVVACAALTAARTTGRLHRATAAAWRSAAVLTVATAPVLASTGPTQGPVVVLGGVLAVATLLVAARRSRLGARLAHGGAVATVVLAVLAALPDPVWTAAALLLGAVLAVLARTWSPAPRSAGASTGTAAVLLVASGATAGAAAGLPMTTAVGLAGAAVVGALLARASLLRPGPGARIEHDTALVVAAAVTAVSWWTASLTPQPNHDGVLVDVAPLAAALSAVALVVLLLWPHPARGARAMAQGGAAAAPVAALAVATVHGTLGVPAPAATAWLVTLAGATATVCAPLLRRRGGENARHTAEVSGAVVAGAGIAVAATLGAAPLAVALLLAAVAAAASALSPGRRAAWWVSLGLGTFAWWVLLDMQGNTLVEPYTMVPALVVAAVGAWRVQRRREDAAPLLVSGLALLTLPTALLPAMLTVGDRWLDRGLLTAGTAAATVGAAVLLRRARPAAAELLAGLAALLVLLGPLRRALEAAGGGDPGVGVHWPDGSPVVEVWAWPAVGALLVCAAVVRTPAARRLIDRAAPWVLVGAAALPTLLAAVTSPEAPSAAARTALVAAAGAALALTGGASGRVWRLPGTAGHPGPGLAGPGLVLLGAAALAATLVVDAHDAVTPLGTVTDLPVLVAGLVTLATVALVVRRGAAAPTAWLAAGALAVVPCLVVRDGALRTVLWTGAAAALLALARCLPPRAAGPWRVGRQLPAPEVRRVLSLAAVGVMVSGPWASAVAAATTAGAPSPVTVELLAVVTWLVATWVARDAGTAPDGVVGRPARIVLLTLPSLLAVDATALGAARGSLVLLGGAALAWWARSGTGTLLGLVTATAGTAALALRGGPEPADVPWTVLGLVALAVGVRQLLRDPARGSWPATGAPLLLALGAPWTALVFDAAGWRVVGLLVLATGAVVAGAVRRWQAPFVTGAVAVVATLAVVLSPVAAQALAAVDGWVLLAVGGALVLGLGVTYERRVQQAREAVRFVGEMR